MKVVRVTDFQAYVSYLRETELPGYVYKIVEDWEDAEDVVRGVVAEALAREDEFDCTTGPEGLREWLRELCRKHAKSYVPFGRAGESPVFGDDAHHRYDDTWEHEKKLFGASLLCLLSLPDMTSMQRECLISEVCGESQVQTAQRLGIKPQTVNQHRVYAKRKANPHHPELPKAMREKARAEKLPDRAANAREFFDELLTTIIMNKEDASEEE